MPTPVVTFDAGLTLIDLDLDYLARRVGERGVSVEPAALAEGLPAAWLHYDALAPTSTHPWKEFMAKLLEGAGVAGGPRGPIVEWLFAEQPHKNLFRKRIEPMIELAHELKAHGVTLAVLSNSEGRLAELLDEIEVSPPFSAIIDSGRLPFAKPDPQIFHHTLEVLGVRDADPVHIGDSWTADVEAALATGWRAIWYRSRAGVAQPDVRVPIARDATEVRAVLAGYGFLPESRDFR